jgi:hypothetical protein
VSKVEDETVLVMASEPASGRTPYHHRDVRRRGLDLEEVLVVARHADGEALGRAVGGVLGLELGDEAAATGAAKGDARRDLLLLEHRVVLRLLHRRQPRRAVPRRVGVLAAPAGAVEQQEDLAGARGGAGRVRLHAPHHARDVAALAQPLDARALRVLRDVARVHLERLLLVERGGGGSHGQRAVDAGAQGARGRHLVAASLALVVVAAAVRAHHEVLHAPHALELAELLLGAVEEAGIRGVAGPGAKTLGEERLHLAEHLVLHAPLLVPDARGGLHHRGAHRARERRFHRWIRRSLRASERCGPRSKTNVLHPPFKEYELKNLQRARLPRFLWPRQLC